MILNPLLILLLLSIIVIGPSTAEKCCPCPTESIPTKSPFPQKFYGTYEFNRTENFETARLIHYMQIEVNTMTIVFERTSVADVFNFFIEVKNKTIINLKEKEVGKPFDFDGKQKQFVFSLGSLFFYNLEFNLRFTELILTMNPTLEVSPGDTPHYVFTRVV
ncbi:hypothetical protein GCK72_026085 [Caenorhabditis remanei]|uniref:DUF38 domain-containing protein n=1 Tax=Caenorhabditis remanei TaxID=31234 RepID=A0A6A5G3W5_CAERE|nr:hypothetical protein GCK72_026085 [Caenorhabditis remanei]KAF1749617.1 hypothetical protein GCK72_026085 [Caenorhabditis remanei]